jgi:peptidoglycan-N-acetylglucosamine deacetylase
VAPLVPSLARALRLPRRVAAPGAVALTFDDGPHPEGTPAILAALAAAGARASFFLVGEQVRQRPALAREILAAGHAVAVHGERHRNHLRLTPAQIRDDVERGAATIAEATGLAPVLYRPPYGILTTTSLAVLRGRPVLLWSRWGRDWSRRETPAAVAARATRDLGAGDVILLHDSDAYSDHESWRTTLAALPQVLDAVGARGLGWATVGAVAE